MNKDRIEWENLIISKGYDNPFLYEYGVEAIPADFLIDPNGKIIAIELTPCSNSNVRGSLNSLLIALSLMSDILYVTFIFYVISKELYRKWNNT